MRMRRSRERERKRDPIDSPTTCGFRRPYPWGWECQGSCWCPNWLWQAPLPQAVVLSHQESWKVPGSPLNRCPRAKERYHAVLTRPWIHLLSNEIQSFFFFFFSCELLEHIVMHELTRYDEIKTVKRMAVNSLAREVEKSEDTSDIFYWRREIQERREWKERKEMDGGKDLVRGEMVCEVCLFRFYTY